MKANELRLGNWIESDHTRWEKKKWIKSRVQFQINERQFLNCFSGQDKFDFIPLTEKWLLKFGYLKDRKYTGTAGVEKIEFETCLYGWSIDGDLFHIVIEGGKFYAVIVVVKIELPYVHSLQNLYFALTGKELTKC